MNLQFFATNYKTHIICILVVLLLLFLLQSLLSLHCTHPSYLLICLNTGFLEPFDSLFQLLPDPDIFPRQFNDPGKPILCSDSQLAKLGVKVIQFRIIRDMSVGNLNLVVIIFIIDGYKSTILPFFLHFLKDFNEILQLLLKFFRRISNQTR